MSRRFVRLQVTDESPSYVWSSELDEPSPSGLPREQLYPVLVAHVRRVVAERDQLANRLVQVRRGVYQPISMTHLKTQKWVLKWVRR